MSRFHGAILNVNLQALERGASGTLSAQSKAHTIAKARRIAVDATALKAGGGDAAVLGDVVQRATALANRLEGKRPAAAPQLAALGMPAAPAPHGNAAAVVQAAATPPASPPATPPQPPKLDHSAGWKRAVAAAGGQPQPDPATSTTAAGWKKAVAMAMGGNL